MSTCNFSYDNILVVIPDFTFKNVCMDEECPHFEEEEKCIHTEGGNYYDYDTEGYNIYVSNIQKQLSKIGYTGCDRWDNNRNYEGKIISYCNIEDKKGNIYQKIEVIIRNGYYEAQNIDYVHDYEDNIPDTKYLQKRLLSKIEKTKKILLKNGTEYYKAYQFSNGEAGYKKVK